MRTDGAIITNAGLELISYAIANNKNITFTKTKLGKGDVNTFDEAKKLTDVVSFYKQIPITSISRNNAGVVRVRSTFSNEGFPVEVVLKEVGIFATVEGKNETLFAYVNDGAGESFPPGTSGNIVERVRDIYIGVSTAIEINAIIDRSTVYATIFDLEEGLNRKEDKFTKNTGFNKNKSDSTSLDDSDILATSKAVKLTMEKATEASTAAAGKEPKFDKNTAFNKNFGTGQNEVLEGSKLAEILGIEYGGVLNNANAKVAGKGYYDTANKKIYKCTTNTSINYADAGYFIEVSNNDLLGKLQNLPRLKRIRTLNGVIPANKEWLFGIIFVRDRATKFYWASYTLYNHAENHILYQHPSDSKVYRYQIRANINGMGIPESSKLEIESTDFYYYF